MRSITRKLVLCLLLVGMAMLPRVVRGDEGCQNECAIAWSECDQPISWALHECLFGTCVPWTQACEDACIAAYEPGKQACYSAYLACVLRCG